METLLPCCVTRFETDDVDDLAHGLTVFEQRFDQLSAGRFHGRFVEVSFGDVQIYCEHTNQSIHEMGSIRANARGFAIAAEVEGRAVFCGSSLTGGELMMLGEGEELDFRTARTMRTVGLVLPIARLAELRFDAPKAGVGKAGVGSGVICANPAATRELQQLIERMLETFAGRPDGEHEGRMPDAALAQTALDELETALAAPALRDPDRARDDRSGSRGGAWSRARWRLSTTT